MRRAKRGVPQRRWREIVRPLLTRVRGSCRHCRARVGQNEVYMSSASVILSFGLFVMYGAGRGEQYVGDRAVRPEPHEHAGAALCKRLRLRASRDAQSTAYLGSTSVVSLQGRAKP